MQTYSEKSFGVIPLYRSEDGLKVLVIHQYGSAGDILWTFPKGKQEAGESDTMCALRELEEETGLGAQLHSEKPYSIAYTFVRDGARVEKVTTYFVGFVTNPDVVLQEKELLAAEWVSPEDAMTRLTYPAYAELLGQVLKDLDK